MIFQRKQTCPNCGATNPPDASYCQQCAKPLAGGQIRCGACGTLNPSDAIYCMECSQPLAQSEAPRISQNRWVAGENDFAVRVDVDDLEGSLKRGINVEAGVNAMLLENGANVGLVPPGGYVLTSFNQRFGNLFRAGLPKQLTILLVKVTPTDLNFALDGIFSKDPLRIGVSVKLQAEIQDPAKFLINVLKGRERFTAEDLRQYLYPEVAGIVDGWVRRHTVQELADDLTLKAKLELALDEALRRTFMQSGLRFLQIRAVELNLEIIDRINGIKSDYALQIGETEALAEGRKRLVDVQHELDLVGLAEETAKVELEERKVELYARMRTAANADKMNEIRSENDFKAFLKEIDRQELLDEKEQNELLRTWQEEAEDHELARRHLIAKLEVEQSYELRVAELKSRTDLTASELDFEMEIESKKLDFELDKRLKTYAAELELERERIRIENERAQHELNLAKLRSQAEREDEAADAELAQQILKNMKEISRLDDEERRRIVREDELARERAAIEFETQRFEMQERQRAGEREFELARLDKLTALSTEQLISISSVEQGKVIAELKRTESLKDMSEEQILALAAEKSPHVAQAFVERYKAIAAGQASQREVELYERLLGEQKDLLVKYETLSDKRVLDVTEANRQAQETSRHAMDRLAETAKAFAEGGSKSPFIVVGGQGGGGQVLKPGSSSDGSAGSDNFKTCVNCGRQVEALARHCPFCGHKFEGV
jgi:ribosomal protein L40E